MEKYKGYICITVDELTDKDSGPAVMSLANYKQLAVRKRIHIVRSGKGLGSYALIDFNSLPARFQTAFVAKYGNPKEVIAAQNQGDAVITDIAARVYFEEYRLQDGSPLGDDKIESYTMTASILNEVIKSTNEVVATRSKLGGSGGMSNKDITIALVESFRAYPGHNLPTSWARLSAKIREYKAKGYESLIEGYLGNKNTVKVTDEVGMLMVALKRSKVPQYNNEQIFHEVNRIAIERGWKTIKSPNTVTAYLKRPDVMPLWYDAKYGSKAAKHKFDRKHKTVMPMVRDALWYGDGTKLNLYYKAYDSAGKLQVKTTQVYEVIDAYSEVFLGYCIADNENYEAQYMAYRMAVETANCRPFEIVNDNQGGHKKLESMQFFDRIARISRRTAPDNGSSKSIESVFGRFQHQVLSQHWAFTGMNITAKSESSRADLEYISANKDNLPTLPELREAYAEYRTKWNNMLHPATNRPRIEMYVESVNPEAQPLNHMDLVDMFWKRTQDAVTFTTSGITISVDGKKYTYEVYDEAGLPDMEFRNKHTYRKFVVKYDPYDMTKVRLYTEGVNGALKFAAVAAPYFEVRRAIQEQQPGDMAFIRQVDEISKQNRVDRYMNAVQLEFDHGVAPEQHGHSRPKVSGISTKSLERFLDNTVKGVTEPITVGQFNKAVSNTTQDNLNGYDKF